jgi:ADP-heptose:LPS heptosyltransferase
MKGGRRLVEENKSTGGRDELVKLLLEQEGIDLAERQPHSLKERLILHFVSEQDTKLRRFITAGVAIRRRIRKLRRRGITKIGVVFPATLGLGDCIIVNSLIALIRKRYPKATITAIVHEQLKLVQNILEHHSWVDHVVKYHPDKTGPYETLEVLSTLALDLCFVGLNSVVSPALLVLSGIPEIVGRSDDSRRGYFTSQIEPVESSALSLHYCAWLMAYTKFLRLKEDEAQLRFPYEPTAMIESAGPGPSIVVHISGGEYWNRRWPAQYYVELLVRLCREMGATIFLLGSPDERTRVEKVRSSVLSILGEARIYNVCGCSINQTANYIAAANCFIGNDSGPMHLAVTLDVPCIAMFGPSDPQQWGPHIYDQKHTIITAALPCRPCSLAYCDRPERDYKCLSDISVDEVWSVITNHPFLQTSTSPV